MYQLLYLLFLLLLFTYLVLKFVGPICSCQWIKLILAEGHERYILPVATTKTFHLSKLSLGWTPNCLSDVAESLESQWPEKASGT